MAEYDTQRGYWSSGPSSGPGVVPDLVNADEHYWGFWWGKEPFGNYATHIARRNENCYTVYRNPGSKVEGGTHITNTGRCLLV